LLIDHLPPFPRSHRLLFYLEAVAERTADQLDRIERVVNRAAVTVGGR
jgi:hypothetical protein